MTRPFMDFLREHRAGVTHDELGEALAGAVTAVQDLNRPASLTLTITIKPAGRDSGALEVGATIAVKAPKPQPGVAIFFATPEGNLLRQDPRQKAMDLRDIAGPAMAHKGVA